MSLAARGDMRAGSGVFTESLGWEAGGGGGNREWECPSFCEWPTSSREGGGKAQAGWRMGSSLPADSVSPFSFLIHSFLTHKGRQICANPNVAWVQEYIRHLDSLPK